MIAIVPRADAAVAVQHLGQPELQPRLTVAVDQPPQEQLSGVEEMLPVGPAARPDKVPTLVPRWSTDFDPHVGHPAVGLPLHQVFSNVAFDDPFAFEVGFGHRAEIVLELPCTGFPAHPLNAVEPLLKEVVGARNEVVLLPQSNAVDDSAIQLLDISAQGRDFGLVPLAVDLVDEEGFPVASFASNGSIFRLPEGRSLLTPERMTMS